MTNRRSPASTGRDAGPLGEWLRAAGAAVRGEGEAQVPCDGCSGCCTSSQFVLVGLDEHDALAHIPEELLFPAPGRPEHVLLGYDERGRCPMLGDDDLCTIYAHRPNTCRTYDCRVFAATGFEVDDDEKPSIAERVRQWRFTYATPDDRVEHDALHAAAEYLRERRGELDQVSLPINATQLAALVIEIHRCFITRGVAGQLELLADPGPSEVRAAVEDAEARLWA